MKPIISAEVAALTWEPETAVIGASGLVISLADTCEYPNDDAEGGEFNATVWWGKPYSNSPSTEPDAWQVEVEHNYRGSGERDEADTLEEALLLAREMLTAFVDRWREGAAQTMLEQEDD